MGKKESSETFVSVMVDVITQKEHDFGQSYWDFIRKAGGVRRCHTARMIFPESVGEHSWGVAAIITQIDPSKSYELLKAAIFHDAAECVTGDIPSTFKENLRADAPGMADVLEKWEEAILKKHGIKFKLTKKEKLLLAWADLLHLYDTASYEYAAGNRVFGSYLAKLTNTLDTLEIPNHQTLVLWITLRELHRHPTEFYEVTPEDWFADL
jgi:5'-deoxynucleotidase YfbR-like HD superfamily hydrolase